MEVEKLLERIENKIDKLDSRLDSQELQMAVFGTILDEHQKRSLANEEMIQTVKAELKPVTQHVAVVAALAKIVGFAGSAVGLIAGAFKLWQMLSGL